MNIAIYEDSKLMGDLLSHGLSRNGHDITLIRSERISSGEILFAEYKFHIIRSSLQAYDSLALLNIIRERDLQSFIIIIASKESWERRVQFIKAGADDVIDYPFPMQELFARIERLASRASSKMERNYTIGEARLDIENRCMILGEKSVDLRKKEYSIMEYLIKNKGRTISRSELIDHIWDYTRLSSSNSVDVHISNIRRKLGNRELIRTVHGFGYKVEEPIKGQDEEKEILAQLE